MKKKNHVVSSMHSADINELDFYVSLLFSAQLRMWKYFYREIWVQSTERD